jgi:signal transduction histidine kinase
MNPLRALSVEAQNGREAWAQLTSQFFNLAIVDLNMPEIDGFELIQCIRGFPRTRHLPVVVVTSNHDSASIMRALEAGATSFMTKPLAWSTFRPHIEFLLKLTNDARVAREALQRAAAVSRAKELVVGRLCSDIVTSAENIISNIRQASLRPVGAVSPASPANAKLQCVLESASNLVTVAQSAHNFIEQLPNDVHIGNDAVSLRTIIDAAVNCSARDATDAGIRFDIVLTASNIVVSCNRQSIELALSQLIRNAVAHSPRGEVVRISASAFPDGLVAVEVSDNGKGMHPDFIAQRLTPFKDGARSGHGGPGRGWPIAMAVAEAHNGKLEIRSMPGQGTSAFFILPPERIIAVQSQDNSTPSSTERLAV